VMQAQAIEHRGGSELTPFRTCQGRVYPCTDVWHRSWPKLRVSRRAGRRSRPRLKSQPPPHAQPTPLTHTPPASTAGTTPTDVCRLPDAARLRRIARDEHSVASQTWANDHNTQRLLPDQKRRLERPVPPRDVREPRERRGEPRAVPPHGNHVRPVAPLVV
jgi:hypothetical protein